MMKYHIWARLCAGLLALCLAAACVGCGNKDQDEAVSNEDFPVTEGGATVKGAPQRIVCLSPAIYEALEALGATPIVPCPG